MNVVRHAPRHARKLHRTGAGIGVGVGISDGRGSISDGEVTSLAGSQQASVGRPRLHSHQQHMSHHHRHQQQQQAGQRGVRLRDTDLSCPGQRRVMHAIRESPEISNNQLADAR